MPGKSQYGRGKHSPRSKRKKGKLGHPAIIAEQSVVAETRQPVSRPEPPSPPAGVPTPMAKLAAIQYPHMATELRTIGILAGIMLVILVVLALALS